MSQETIDFTIKFEGRPEKPINLMMYAFDEKGEAIAAAKVEGNLASLTLTDDQAKRARIVFAPAPAEGVKERRVNIDQVQRRQAYLPEWKFNPRIRKYELLPIPEIFWKYWWWCKCQVKGKIVKKVTVGTTTEEWPVYLARVHICEVDPLWLILKRLPDREILHLRDDLMKEVGNPIPQPPEPPVLFEKGLIDPSPENVARMNMELPIRLKAPVPERPPRRVVVSKKLEIPAGLRTTLSSTSAETVRATLATKIQLIRPYLCRWRWIWPFLRCDEVAVVETDKQGQFDADVWYLCGGDHPDIYFWVEYQIGSAWTTVYHPPMICYTYWNYACGTEVVIPISDPRVPWYVDPISVPGKQVAVLSIGHDISIKEIKRVTAAADEGLTETGEPFGGSLEPTVWFGDGISGSGITHYRWSYRRLTKADGTVVADVWHAVDYRVVRHYGEIWADGTLVFKPFMLGPDPDIPGAALFKLQPKNPPINAGVVSVAWAPQIDARENTASAFFLSHLLEGGNPKEAAGKYELKLELFRYNSVAHVVNRVNLTDEGVLLKTPIGNAPFGAGVVPTRVVPHDPLFAPDMEDRIIREGPSNKIVAFRLVLHVDNNPCEAEIYPVKVSGAAPGTWETVGTCGFLRYKLAPPAQALLSFRAAHPNNFARFVFTVVKGSTGYVTAACAPSNPSVAWTSLPLVKDNPVNGFIRDASSVYTKEVPVSGLVGACPDGTAAFGENLSVYPLATDGWSTLWYLSKYGVPVAFALQPKP